nr:LysR family transcriptional regulator [Rhizobium subbaraonis]
MNYNLRSLQALEAVYRRRSVAHAAGELNVTASAISHQLRKLSADVGEWLVRKSGRGVELTEAGERLAVIFRSHVGAWHEASPVDRMRLACPFRLRNQFACCRRRYDQLWMPC